MDKALETAIQNVLRAHGKGSIMLLGSTATLDIDVISSGSLAIDQVLGTGGFPKGRVVEIFGPEMSGKTTVALHVIAQSQREGGNCLFVDAEHALDPEYARNLGVDTSKLLVAQPDNGEQALEIVETMIKSGSVNVVVVDSVSALVPRAELDGEFGQSQMGLQARLLSQAMRKLTAVTAKTGCLLIFINQLREKIGVIFGSNETTSGGRALKFFSSIRMDVRRIKTNSEDDVKVSNTVRIKIVKNKISIPYRETEVELKFGEGICHEKDLITFGVEKGLIQKAGAWYTFNEKRFQGEDALKDALKQSPEVADDLETNLRAILFPPKEEK